MSHHVHPGLGLRRWLRAVRQMAARFRFRTTAQSPVRLRGPLLRRRSQQRAEYLEHRLMLTLNIGLSSGNLLIEETTAGADDLNEMGDVIDVGNSGLPVDAALKTMARFGAKSKPPCAAAN